MSANNFLAQSNIAAVADKNAMTFRVPLWDQREPITAHYQTANETQSRNQISRSQNLAIKVNHEKLLWRFTKTIARGICCMRALIKVDKTTFYGLLMMLIWDLIIYCAMHLTTCKQRRKGFSTSRRGGNETLNFKEICSKWQFASSSPSDWNLFAVFKA